MATGVRDIVTGQASGGGGVRVFSGTDYSLLLSQTPFGPGYTGGLNVAAGDVDGDGRVEVIVAQAVGGTVAVISGETQAIMVSGAPYGFLPGGVFVAAADVNGDGRADVIASPGSGTGPVLVYNIATLTPITSFAPYGTTSPGGVRVAAADLTGDGRAEIITVPGPGREPELKVFSGSTFALLSTQLAFQATYTGGVFVSTSEVRRLGTRDELDCDAALRVDKRPRQLLGQRAAAAFDRSCVRRPSDGGYALRRRNPSRRPVLSGELPRHLRG